MVLALQTLGGDPQTSYVTGLFAGGYALALWWVGPGVRGQRGLAVAGRAGGAWLAVAWVAAVLGYAAATAPEGGR